MSLSRASDALDDHRDALAHADAHGAQRVATVAALQLVGRGGISLVGIINN